MSLRVLNRLLFAAVSLMPLWGAESALAFNGKDVTAERLGGEFDLADHHGKPASITGSRIFAARRC